MWGVALSCWNFPSPLECTMDMDGCRWSARMHMYVTSVRVVSRCIKGPHITPTAHTPHHYRASTSLNNSLLTYRVHGFMSLSPYLYTSICSTQLERDSPDQATCFQSNVGVEGPKRGIKLCVVQSARVQGWAFSSKSPH